MKIGNQFTAIDQAFASLMASLQDMDNMDVSQSHPHSQRRVRRDLPMLRSSNVVPQIVQQYPPAMTAPTQTNKLFLLRLAAFEATYANNITPLSPDSYPLILDTGASISVTPYKTDFISPIRPIQSLEIQGIASGLQVQGSGSVQYKFYNDAGHPQTIVLKHCLYVPQCTARLICPRQLCIQSTNPQDGFNSTGTHGILTYQGQTTTIPYDNMTQLPVLYTAPGCSSYQRFCAHQSYLKQTTLSTLNPTEPPQFLYCNLTPNQQKKLHLHERCAHVGWHQLNSWIRQGLLPCDPALAKEPDPVCAACQFGKAHKKPHLADVGSISKDHLAPGDGVSTDGMEAGTPGRVFSSSGLPSPRKYRYATFWVDHYSRYVHVTMHETKKAEELLRSKADFEAFAARFNVKIKNIRADNGVYTARTIQTSCLVEQQTLSFCAVGAHWQNGLAERFIGTIVQRARTLLLHAMSKWPSVITEDFWPFAIRYMVMFHNSTIRRDKPSSPYELFTGQQPTWSLADFRVFGCPTYVLHKRLQDGQHFGKWQARSWQGIYVGPSAQHASNVPLIYNPSTTHVTPQFHVAYDEGFTSVTHLSNSELSKVIDKIFDRASWMKIGQDDKADDYYYFDSFWEGPPVPPLAPNTTKKRSHAIMNDSTDCLQTNNSNTLTPVSGLIPNVDSTISECNHNSNTILPPVSGHEGASTSRNEGESSFHNEEAHSLETTQVVATDQHITAAVSAINPNPKVQYTIYKGSIPYQQAQAALDLACRSPELPDATKPKYSS